MSDQEGTPNFEKPTPEGQPQQPYQQGAFGTPTPPPAPPAQPYGAPAYGGPQQPVPMSPDQERMWGGAAHWSALVASVVALAFLGPLVVMLAKGNDSPWVRRQAVESLNFQLSMLIYGVVGSIVGVILALVTFGIALIVLIPLGIALGIAWLVFTILAAIKASNGEDYRYPLTMRMVS